jgi:hypothetical protein
MFIVAVCIVGMIALCVLLAWMESKARLCEAIERAMLTQRHRFAAYLRDEADKADKLSKCGLFSAAGRHEEAYASAVLTELAEEVALGAAEKVRVEP